MKKRMTKKQMKKLIEQYEKWTMCEIFKKQNVNITYSTLNTERLHATIKLPSCFNHFSMIEKDTYLYDKIFRYFWDELKNYVKIEKITDDFDEETQIVHAYINIVKE